MSIGLSTPVAARQTWYQTYDEALRDVQKKQWRAAEEKLVAVKKTGPRPGRRVLRYGQLREPFIPDFYLAQVYVALAEEASEPAAKRDWARKALDALELAGVAQVGPGDPEFKNLGEVRLVARKTLDGVSGLETAAPEREAPTTNVPDPDNRNDDSAARLAAARGEVQRYVQQGEKALGAGEWDLATTAWQQASDRLAQTPALRTEFAEVPSRLRDAMLGRDITVALQSLRAGRFAAALDGLEKSGRGAEQTSPAVPALRALASDVPNRVREARAGQTLVSAEEAFRNRHWGAALKGFESAREMMLGIELTAPLAKELAAHIPARIREAGLNSAIAEKRFGEALAIDPSNRTALEGQYSRALDAYNGGQWTEAVAEFKVLVALAPTYRDVGDRAAAAELHVEYALGVDAEQAADTAVARGHFERAVQLQRSIRGALMESAAIVRSVEGATDRLRRIDANAGLATARRQYENGQWDEARNSVNLVLRLLPGDQDATALLRLLDDSVTGHQVQALIRTAKLALARRDLDQATAAATELQTLLPQNADAMLVLSEVARIRDEQRRWYQWMATGAAIASVGPILLLSTRRRGRFFAAIGRPTAALRLYDKVLAKNPADGATLARAADLAATNGMSAPLGPHFDAYLRSHPDDARLSDRAADFYWRQGDTAHAARLYEALLTSAPAAARAEAFERLGDFYQADLPASLVSALERARNTQSDGRLWRLLARQYGRAERTDAEALEVYRIASTHAPEDTPLRLSLAKALLARGDWPAAATEAGHAARTQPHGAPLVVLTDALVNGAQVGEGDVVERLDAIKLPAEAMLVVAERLVAAQPTLRAQFAPLYERERRMTRDPQLASVLLAHARMDTGDADGAMESLDAMPDPATLSDAHLRPWLDAHLRLLALTAANGQPSDAAMIARVAQLHSAARQWDDAIRVWQSIVSVPEWNRRAMAAIESILDGVAIGDTARAYFATSDWSVVMEARPAATSSASCVVTPGRSVSADLSEQSTDTPVFCYTSVVTVDDVVALKRDVLARRGAGDDAIAFMLSTQAVRHEVYALIYAFMTEEPAVTVIPLEVHSVRDAIVESRSRVHLERTLRQWLGHTDIFETHNPVSNAATFFGRGQFINQLVLKISRGENFGIFGLRKIGKTSLIYRLRELSRHHLVAYVDLQGVASRRTDEVYLRLLESLARDARVKYPEVHVPIFELSATTVADGHVAERFHADVLALRRALEACVPVPPNMLLLLDEIELMVPYANSPGFDGHQEFFRHIRGLFQQERFIVSALVGATPTVCRTAKWGVRDNPVFQFYDEIFLAMLDRGECDQMVQGLGELMGIRFDRPSLDLIFDQTAGHPYVTRQLCTQLVRTFRERPLQVRRDMVLVGIEEYLAQRGDYFAGLVEGYLDDDARRLVETIAVADEAGETRAQLVQTLGASAGPHVADRVLGDLELVGMIVRGPDRYRLRAPLFRRWLRRSWLGLE